jgi:uncharacterized membrane protein YeiH
MNGAIQLVDMMTATFGSIIRDTLLNQKPVLLGPEIDVTAALRASALFFDLRLPKYGR